MAYRHLTLDDREYIEYIHGLGYSQAYIARILGVHRSTISSELKRNSYMGKYDAWVAHELSQDRKKRASAYLLRRKRLKIRRAFYRPPYRDTSFFDRVIRLREVDKRLRTGRKKKEWRVVRRDACQFYRNQEDLRFSRGTHVEAWRRKKQPKRLRSFYPASPFRTLTFSGEYYPTYPQQRKRKTKTSFRKITAAAWRTSTYRETGLSKTNPQRPVKKYKPINADPGISVQAVPELDSSLQNTYPLPAVAQPGIRKSVSKNVDTLPSRVTSCLKSGEFLPDPSPP